MKFKTVEGFLGLYLIDIEPYTDYRGFFARTYCSSEFLAHGLDSNFVQQSISWNPNMGTLRGMHFQLGPHAENKLIRVTRGAIYDVVVDLRINSPSYKKWFGVELSALSQRQLYIPKGFAHGFQTIEENTEVLYHMTTPFALDNSAGFSWADPNIGINWPYSNDRIIGARDLALKNFCELDSYEM